MPANKKQDQCPSARCICSLKPLTRFGIPTQTVHTVMHTESVSLPQFGKQTEKELRLLSRDCQAKHRFVPCFARGIGSRQCLAASSARTVTWWRATAKLAPKEGSLTSGGSAIYHHMPANFNTKASLLLMIEFTCIPTSLSLPYHALLLHWDLR